MPYEFKGKQYEKASSHQREWGKKLISDLSLIGNERILDLGCGDVTLTAHLAELVPQGFVLGIDASRGMLETAREKKKYNLAFKLLDINALNLSEKFDVIFSNAALHWIRNHHQLWSSVKNILSDRGIVRVNFAAEGTCSFFFKVLRRTMTRNEYRSSFKDFDWPWYMPSLEEYKKIISTVHFSEIKVWKENADRYFAHKEDLIKWIDQPGIVPFLHYIPKDKKERFRETVIRQMIEETLQEDGRCFETFRRINMYARK